MASRIATYEYLNILSSSDMPTTSKDIKKCVNPYDFAMNQNYNGYFTDLKYTGPSVSSSPWPLASRDDFREEIPYYAPKLTLTSQPSGYPSNATLIWGVVWNTKPTSYQNDHINISSVTGFVTPAVTVQGGYEGASSTESPTIPGNALFESLNLTVGTFFDVVGGAYNPTSHSCSKP